jgi:acetyl esterase/lipase
MTAWRFVCRQGIPADRIAVGGDSAGGNLAVTHMLRDLKKRPMTIKSSGEVNTR